MLARGEEVSKARILKVDFRGIVVDNSSKAIIYCSLFIHKGLCPGIPLPADTSAGWN
jgi:hypothetical protein